MFTPKWVQFRQFCCSVMEQISLEILNRSGYVLKNSLKNLQVVGDLFIGMILQYIQYKCCYSCSGTNIRTRHSQSYQKPPTHALDRHQ